MADGEERFGDLSDESADTVDFPSSECSTSSDSESEEEKLAGVETSFHAGKKTKRANRNAAASSTKSSQQRKKPKIHNSALTTKEMEDLASWTFSSEEAKKVEQQIRSTLLVDPRVKSQTDRKKFAEHLLCATEEPNFQLLVIGFCRRFSTLAQESFASNLENYRKVSFSVSWMKLLTNFQPGKATQERMIIERLLRNSNVAFPSDSVHSVLSVVHETVYCVIHEHIRQKKADTEASEYSARQRTCQLAEESDDTLYRYCGAALHRMIKLREETLAGKQGRGELSKKREPILQKELEILRELVMKDKSYISDSLKNLDEGNLSFPRNELIPYLRSVDKEVREYATDSNLRKYPSKFLTMCQTVVLNNENLKMDFRILIASLVDSPYATHTELINGLFHGLTSKLANTRINEFMNAKMERDLKDQGKVVDADEMLRPRLKAYALATKRS